MVHKAGKVGLVTAIITSSVLSSSIVFLILVLIAKPILSKYVEAQVRGHQATVEAYARDSISQQIMMGDASEVFRKCHAMLQDSELQSIFVKDLSGEVACDLRKESNQGSALRWTSVPIFFDQEQKHVATTIKLGFSRKNEERLSLIMMGSTLIGAAALFMIQIMFTVPLVRRVLRPLRDLSDSVGARDPKDILLPDIKRYRPLVSEVSLIFSSIHTFIQHIRQHEERLIESARYEAMAHTAQTIAHDLRAPLGVFERLLSLSDDSLDRYRAGMRDSLNRMHSMIESFRYAEVDRMVVRSRVDFSVDYAVKSLESKAQERSVTIHSQQPASVRLHVDGPKLERALINLLANALDFARSQVTVECKSEVDVFIIRIIDDGPGVSEEFSTRLFQRGATYGKADGTGLGLAYVRQIMRGHGGDVTYKRENGLTLFECRLPHAVLLEKGQGVESQGSMDIKIIQKIKRRVAICLEPAALSEDVLSIMKSSDSDELFFTEERGGAHIVVSNVQDIMIEVLENDEQEYISVAQLKLDRIRITELLKRKLNIS